MSGIRCVEQTLKLFRPDYVKVASFHLDNIPLVSALAETKIPIIISTGTVGARELDDALNVIARHHSDISILHCVSEYPTHPKNANLKTIEYLRESYSQYKIGYSDHTIGISAAISGVALGAEIIEKHITLDRKMKGSDHIASLGPDGMYRLCRDVRLLEMMLGERGMFVSEGEKASIQKMGRSLALNRTMEAGHTICESDLHLLAPGDGLHWKDREKIVGKRLRCRVDRNELVYPQHVQ